MNLSVELHASTLDVEPILAAVADAGVTEDVAVCGVCADDADRIRLYGFGAGPSDSARRFLRFATRPTQRALWGTYAPFERTPEAQRDRFCTLKDVVDPVSWPSSPMFQQLYRPAGVVDEARMIVCAGEVIVARVAALRLGNTSPFDEGELRRLRRRQTHIAEVARATYNLPSAADTQVVLGANGDLLHWSEPEPDDDLLGVAREAVARHRERADGRLATMVGSHRVRTRRLHSAGHTSYLVQIDPCQPLRLHPLGRLTARQQQVAELAAVGLSTREIAETLDRSAHTVQTLLKHAYARLGVVNRVELAQLFE
ncbi:MAG: helix-turn-helix domain-containing protein [Myxococcales bacterium]|nr:helix-turn-helix domain-containing protein [Myxococcales bacterium]